MDAQSELLIRWFSEGLAEGLDRVPSATGSAPKAWRVGAPGECGPEGLTVPVELDGRQHRATLRADASTPEVRIRSAGHFVAAHIRNRGRRNNLHVTVTLSRNGALRIS